MGCVLGRSALFYDRLSSACSVVFWVVLVCSVGFLGRSGLFYDILGVMACS